MADGYGSTEYVAREIIKQDNIVDFTTHEGFADKFAKRIGASMTNAVMSGSFLGSMKLH